MFEPSMSDKPAILPKTINSNHSVLLIRPELSPSASSCHLTTRPKQCHIPESFTFSIQSWLCLVSSLVSLLGSNFALPLRYTALGCLPKASSSKLALRRSLAEFFFVRKFPLGEKAVVAIARGAIIPSKTNRKAAGDSLNKPVPPIALGSTERTEISEYLVPAR